MSELLEEVKIQGFDSSIKDITVSLPREKGTRTADGSSPR